MNYNINSFFAEQVTFSPSWFLCGSYILIELEFRNTCNGFWGGRKTGELNNNNKFNPHMALSQN